MARPTTPSSTEWQETIIPEPLHDIETNIDDTLEAPAAITVVRSLEMLTNTGYAEGEDVLDRLSNQTGDTASALKEQVNLVGATADESMAVEALRQLRGMFHMNDEGIGYADIPSPCKCCGQQFHSEHDLHNHVALCQQSSCQLHICNICNMSFVRKSDLGNHIVCHQADKTHTCHVCGNVYRRKADLQNHMVSHQTSRPHRCNECGVDFQRPSSLTNHMKIHSYHPGRAMLNGTDSFSTKLNSQYSKKDKHISEQLSIDHKDESVGTLSCLSVQELNSTIDNETSSNESTTANPQACNDAELGDTVYDCLNTGSTSPGINDPTSNSIETTNYQLHYLTGLSTQQPIKDELNVGTYEYFEVPAVSATVDIETTDLNDQSPPTVDVICELNPFQNSESQIISLNTNNFTNAPVKVETLPYYLLDESHLQLQEEVLGMEIDPLKQVLVNTPVAISLDSSKPHMCSYCSKVFSRANALASHVRVHHGEWGDMLQCRNCEDSFYDAATLARHRQSCTGVRRPVDSTQFQKVVKSNDSMRQSKEKHCCSNCDKKFTTKQKLYRHMWIHRKKQFVCEVCGVSLGHQEGLEEHRRSLHPGETPYVCQDCGRGFASRQGLWEHGRIHGSNSSSQYRCPHCNKTFSSRQGYLIHTRTHTGERPYGCRFCMKAFRDGGTLRKHERIHTGERPHVCPLCYRAFNQKVVLREHVRWVHAANRDELESDVDHLFICEVCNNLLGDREELCAHIVKHSDDLAKAAKAQPKQDDTSALLQIPIKVSTQRSLKKSKIAKEPKISKKDKIPSLPLPIVPVVVTKPLPVMHNGSLHTSNNHMVKSHNSTSSKKAKVIHTCQMCSETFVKRKQLLKHVRIHI